MTRAVLFGTAGHGKPGCGQELSSLANCLCRLNVCRSVALRRDCASWKTGLGPPLPSHIGRHTALVFPTLLRAPSGAVQGTLETPPLCPGPGSRYQSAQALSVTLLLLRLHIGSSIVFTSQKLQRGIPLPRML